MIDVEVVTVSVATVVAGQYPLFSMIGLAAPATVLTGTCSLPARE